MKKQTLVFYWPRHRERAEACAAALRRDGVPARLRSMKGWLGMVEEPAARVICDDADVARAYAEAGSEVDMLFGEAPETEAQDEASDEGGDPQLPDGYELVQSGSWHKVVGPDGQQVGNAKRSPEEAMAQVVGD